MSASFTALRKRATAFVGAVALTGLALFGGASAATAAPAGPGNVDFDAIGSITVHKHEQPAVTGTAGDGSELATPPAKPLAGVPFSVQLVDIDLTDPAVWDDLESLDPVTAPLTGTPTTLTTDAEGIAKFTERPVGVYLVTEGDAPADLGIVSKAAPFFVVIPTSIEDTWTYHVHAYPKNSLSKLEKYLDEDVDATSFGEGDPVVWNISSMAPTFAASDTFTAYSITDTLDARLAYVSVSNVQYNGVALDAADYTVTVDGQTVTVALIDYGLAKVKAESGKMLTFDLNTVVTGDIGDGVIPNTATQITNVNGQKTTVDSNKDETYWGNVNIVKQDKANALKLAGAEFQVFATEADALAGTNPISVNGVSTFTTGADGSVVISALNVGADGTSRDYWIVETKAPAGYVLDSAPRMVTVVPGANAEVVYTIDNTKQDRPDLPLTGATGTAIFVLGGTAIALTSAGLAMRNSRRARA